MTERYLTADLPGIGGRLKEEARDFIVEELPLYEPSGQGEHTFFEIRKEGLSTFQAVRTIAQALGVPPRRIGYAGLKDAQAITRQVLSVEGVPPAAVLALDLPGLCDHATTYFPSGRVCFTRVSEPRNRSPRMAPPERTGLLVEVPCSPGDPLHGAPPRRILARVLGDLAYVGMLNPSRVISWRHHALPRAYPVLTPASERLAASIRQALSGLENLYLLGRGAQFRYTHLHDHISEAAALAEKLAR